MSSRKDCEVNRKTNGGGILQIHLQLVSERVPELRPS